MRNFRANYTTDSWSGTCGILLSTALLISCSYPWRSPPDSVQFLPGLSESSLDLPRVAVCCRNVVLCSLVRDLCLAQSVIVELVSLFACACVHGVGSCVDYALDKKNWLKKIPVRLHINLLVLGVECSV